MNRLFPAPWASREPASAARIDVSRRAVLGGALGISAIAALSACSGAASAGSSGAAAQVLKWGWRLPSTWDAAKGIGYDVHVLSLVYSGLTKLAVDGSVEPDLAEAWEYNTKGDAVTFTLREGLTFTDGAALDAAAVKKSLLRGRDTKDATARQALLAVKDIEVVDPTNVKILLTETNYQIPLLLAGLVGHLLSPNAIDGGENIALKPVGAGPFVLESYVPDSQATVKRNPDYWNAAEIKLESLQILPKPEATVAVAGVTSGQYTVAHIPESQIDAAKAAGLRVDVNKIYNVHTLQPNTSIEPFGDQRVLDAISHAVDRQGIIDGLFFGYGEADHQPFPKGHPGYNTQLEGLYDRDLAEAKSLLAAAGFAEGFDTELWVSAETQSQQIGEVLQTQLGEVGIRITLKTQPPGAGLTAAHDYPLYLSSFSGRESPVQAFEVLYDADGWMNNGESEPKGLQDALTLVRETPLDDPDYDKVLQAATKLAVTEESPQTFLVNWVRAYAINSSVKGLDAYVHTQRFENVELVAG